MTDIASARIFVDEAIQALSVEMYKGRDFDDMERVDPIEATIAIELERVDTAIGPKGHSMFATLADNIKQAMAALHGAKEALK